MLLALLTMAIAFVVGLTCLATSRSTITTANTTAAHAQARHIAESGLAIATSYIEHTTNWRTLRSQGPWIHNYPMLGGTLNLDALFTPEIAPSITPADASFEAQNASLATPVLNPPMSGTIGGWTVKRTATLVTGATVPQIGSQTTSHATQGPKAGYISFGLSVTGSGTFSQTIPQTLKPRTKYTLAVDVTVSTAVSLTFSNEIRIKAGSTLIASSSNAYTLTLPTSLGTLPSAPANPNGLNDTYESLLTFVGVGPGASTTYTLSFTTDNHPPAGNIAIELYAKSSGLVASIWFDNVRLSARQNDPVTITATGICGPASHIVQANVVIDNQGAAKVIDWKEP